MPSNSQIVASGSSAVGGNVYQPWPQQWDTNQWWPNTYVYPTYTYTVPAQDYANEVEVERGEHDATLHFYRSSGPGKGKTLVKTITVPLGVLEWLAAPDSGD